MSICCDEPPQPTYLAPPESYGGYPTEPPPNYQQPQPYIIQTSGGSVVQSPYVISGTIPPQTGQTTYIATTTTTTGNNPQQPQTTTTTTKFYKVAWLSQQQRNKPQSKSLSAGELYLFYGNFFFEMIHYHELLVPSSLECLFLLKTNGLLSLCKLNFSIFLITNLLLLFVVVTRHNISWSDSREQIMTNCSF